MVGNTCLDYLGNHSTFTGKFFLPRDSPIGEILLTVILGVLVIVSPYFMNRKCVGKEFENERKKHD